MNGKNTPKANMAMVARTAGVSRATVSNVLNYPDRVLPQTRDAVIAAIEELQFVRNGVARTLAAGRAYSIGIIVSGFDHSFSSEVILSAQKHAIAAGMHVVITCSSHSIELQDEHLRYLHGEGVAAVILIAMPNSDESIRQAMERGTNLVLIDYDGEPLGCSSVRIDNIATGRLVAEHLIKNGKSRLHFVGPGGYRPVIGDRLKGVQEATINTKLTVAYVDDLSTETAIAYGTKLAQTFNDNAVDGIIAATDTLGLGIIQGMRQNSIDMPEQVAIAGCDYNAFAWSGDLPLTTVDLQGARMGEYAMSQALAQIHQHPIQPNNIILQPELIIRASSKKREVC